MKFAKHLQDAVSHFPEEIASAFFPYKAAKKMLNNGILSPTFFERRCIVIDKVFTRNACRICEPTIFDKTLHDIHDMISCHTDRKSMYLDSTKTYEFALLNQLAIRKIIKKMNKRGCFQDTMKEWYAKYKTKYNFVQSSILTKLKLGSGIDKFECPICLESIDDGIVVMECGHGLCVSCAVHVAGMQGSKGTLMALLSYARNKTCPICRHVAVFEKCRTLPTDLLTRVKVHM